MFNANEKHGKQSNERTVADQLVAVSLFDRLLKAQTLGRAVASPAE